MFQFLRDLEEEHAMARFQEEALQHEMSSERPPQTLANGHRSVADLQAELEETTHHRLELGRAIAFQIY
jgi:hypothetical protein